MAEFKPFLDIVSGLGPSGLLALSIWLLIRGKVRVEREVTERDAQIAALKTERDFWQGKALEGMRLAGRATSVSEQVMAKTATRDGNDRPAETEGRQP